ncbi:MAG: hypothetical protein WBD05_09995 [Phycisphaerae bacterium]
MTAPSNRKQLPCERCGRSVTVGVEAEAARCWACTGFQGDPPQGPVPNLETPRLADVKECANYVGQGCIVREHGRCIVLDGQRCGWWEKAVRPGGRLSGRVCATCGGEVLKHRRFCKKCQMARRRAANREAQRRKRVSCQQSVAPTPLNCQEFEVAQGTFREGRPKVAAHAQNADMGEDDEDE